MFERILVPLDGSRHSEEMIPYALGLARAHDTPVALLRVLDQAADEAQATRYVETLAASHGARPLTVPARGDVADAVLQEAARVPATLVAMTSRGRSGLMEAVLGSVAQRVLRGAGAPVLLYRPTGGATDQAVVALRSVVLPLDGSALSEGMGEQAGAFARWAGIELEVVRAVDADTAARVGAPAGEVAALESGYVRAKATELGARHGVRINWDVLHGDPAKSIASFVAGRRDVVLAMVTRRQSAMQSALLGSVTAECLRTAGVPILMRLPAD